MEKVTSELLREYVNSQKFSSTADIMEAMKDLFKDALQQVMEGALEEKFGVRKKRKNAGEKRIVGVEKLQKRALEKACENATGRD